MNMNTAIGAPTYRPHGGFRKHQVAIFAGLVALAAAVVAVVAVITTPWSDGSSSASAGRVAIKPFTAPAMIVYLVGSEEQAQALIEEQIATAALLERDGIAPTPYQVLVAGTISDESIALGTLAEMRSRWDRAGATGLVVEDLR